jgi:hypothetical protein
MSDWTLCRRQYLSGVAVGLACATAACSQQQTAGGDTPTDGNRPPCADGFRVVEESARVESGTVPEVRLRLENAGDSTVAYEIRVIFQQSTSLGIEARTGRDSLSGTVSPGETLQRQATDDSYEIQNTDTYLLETSVRCPADGQSG